MDAETYNKKALERQWLIENIDKVRTLADDDLVIDCFNLIYVYYGNGCGTVIDKIHLKDLVKLWNDDFNYQGYPIVEYYYAKGSHSIKYIKDNKLETVKAPINPDILNKIPKRDFTNYKTIADIMNLG